MMDVKTSLTATLAWVGWTIGLLLVAAGVATHHLAVGQFGLLCGAGAAVLHIRTFFCNQTDCIREAFAAGRAHGHEEATGVPVQRIR